MGPSHLKKHIKQRNKHFFLPLSSKHLATCEVIEKKSFVVKDFCFHFGSRKSLLWIFKVRKVQLAVAGADLL